jgi:hypothetical protein
MDEELLSIYLNDHLAGAIAGLEVAKRCRSSNEGNPFGTFLQRLTADIDEDRQTLEDVMDRLGFRRNPAKKAGAWLLEKVGRLKLNGRLVGYSDLSRLLELEGLAIGVEGKLSMWRSLSTTGATDQRLSGIDFEDLIARAERQRSGLEENRLEAARIAFGA